MADDQKPWDYLMSRLDEFERRMREHNQSLRAEMSVRFASLEARVDRRATAIEVAMASHAKDHDIVDARVLVIETQRELEGKLLDKQILKRGGWAGILGAFGLTAGWEFIKQMMKP